jgi:hypothetical protein
MRRPAALTAIVAILLGLGGCGGGSGSDSKTFTIKSTGAAHPVEGTRFGKRVGAICFRRAAELGSLPRFPNPQFDPLHPAPSELPEVGRFFEQNQVPAFQKLIVALRKVDPPPAYEKRYDEFVTQLESLVANLKRQAATAKSSDVNGFVAAIKDAGGLGLPKAESALGITACYGIA